MTTNLYDILGVGRHASAEEVRKAYRRKALETHPDRLRQGASAAEKSAAEDMFRKVNNAYEVLHDPQSRSEYDQYGVWPPPSAPQGPSANGPHDPFSGAFRDPFFQDPFFRAPRRDPFNGFGFGPRHGPRGFTDPFVLFNSIFGDLQRAFESDPFFDDSFGRRGFGSGSNHFGGGFFGGGFPSMLPSPFDLNGMGMGNSSSSRMQTFSGGSNGPGGGWVSQSWSSSTVNGVTHTKSVRRDAEGNEHVTYRYPDGTERHTINGIEQSTSRSQPQRALPAPAAPVYPTQVDNLPPPPSYYDSTAQQPHRSRPGKHHVQFYDSGDKHEGRHRHRQDHGQARDREYDDWTRHGHHDDRYGYDGQGSSSRKFWKS